MSNPAFRLDILAVTAVYFIAGLFTFTQPMDLITNTWPIQPGSVQWRYGFIGLMAGFVQTPLLGVLIGSGAAVALGNTRALRVFSVIALGFAAAIIVAAPLFALDVLQLRGTVPAERVASFQAGALIAELKHLTTGAAFLLIGIGGLKSARNVASGKDR